MTAGAQSVGSWLHSSRRCRISDSIASPTHNRDCEVLVRFNRVGAPKCLPSLACFKMDLVSFYDARSRVALMRKRSGFCVRQSRDARADVRRNRMREGGARAQVAADRAPRDVAWPRPPCIGGCRAPPSRRQGLGPGPPVGPARKTKATTCEDDSRGCSQVRPAPAFVAIHGVRPRTRSAAGPLHHHKEKCSSSNMGERMLQDLVPPYVATACRTGDSYPVSRLPAEDALVAGAVASRRQEFTTARYCARQALKTLGVNPMPILRGPHGEPAWPTGVVGSK